MSSWMNLSSGRLRSAVRSQHNGTATWRVCKEYFRNGAFESALMVVAMCSPTGAVSAARSGRARLARELTGPIVRRRTCRCAAVVSSWRRDDRRRPAALWQRAHESLDFRYPSNQVEGCAGSSNAPAMIKGAKNMGVRIRGVRIRGARIRGARIMGARIMGARV